MQTKGKGSGRRWIVASIFHLSLMAAGAAHLPIELIPVLGPPLSYYSHLSGASNSYGFFSPGVGGQLLALIDIYDRSGHKLSTAIEAGENREVALRINDIIEQFTDEHHDRVKFQRSLSASRAGSIFAQHPNIKKVEVRIETLQAVSRRAFLKGKIASWKATYSAQYIHKPHGEVR